MRRYHIVEGDKTTADGVVQPHTGAGATFKWHGKTKSYVGDKVLCKACQSVVVIEASGSRLSFSVNGLMPALGGDLCICKCSPPPKLVHSQTVFYETTNDSHSVTSNSNIEKSSSNINKKIIEMFWTYSKDYNPLNEESRHYVDINLHVKTQGYSVGETVSVTIKYDDDDILFNEEKILNLTGTVNDNKEVVFEELFKNGTLNLK